MKVFQPLSEELAFTAGITNPSTGASGQKSENVKSISEIV